MGGHVWYGRRTRSHMCFMAKSFCFRIYSDGFAILGCILANFRQAANKGHRHILGRHKRINCRVRQQQLDKFMQYPRVFPGDEENGRHSYAKQSTGKCCT